MSTDPLDASCLFCSYNGEGYYQAGTHAETCPWFRIGGHDERRKSLRDAITAALNKARCGGLTDVLR